MNHTYRCASYNILCGGFPSYDVNSGEPERLPKIQSAVKKLAADYCTLIDTYMWDKKYQSKDLELLFGYPYSVSINLEDNSTHQTGITVLSIFPIINTRIIPLYLRNSLVTTIEINHTPIDIVSLYLDYAKEETRLKQVMSLFDQFKSINPTILLGDLNCLDYKENIILHNNLLKFILKHPFYSLSLMGKYFDMSKKMVIPYIEKNGFINASAKHIPTIPTKLLNVSANSPLIQIDYAFSRGEIKLSNFTVPHDQIFDEASDHYPIIFDFSLPEKILHK